MRERNRGTRLRGGAPGSSARLPAAAGLLGAAVGVLAAALWLPTEVAAQGGHFEHPPAELERILTQEPFEVASSKSLRKRGRTRYAELKTPDGTVTRVKLTLAPIGGGEFNNRPRYEAALYWLQKLFLEEDEHVVPPTACRCLPVGPHPNLPFTERATFEGTTCKLVSVQAWLRGVTAEAVFDEERFESDSSYARHLANVDILTYLVDHKDANVGNVVVSQPFLGGRVFAIDNGVAFGSAKSNRGTEWGGLRVKRVPEKTVERLRDLELSDLTDALAVFAQFEQRGAEMVRVAPTEPFDPGKGVHLKDGVLQLGLTGKEIRSVDGRIQKLLRRVEKGELETF